MDKQKICVALLFGFLVVAFSSAFVIDVGAEKISDIGSEPSVAEGDKIQINNYLLEIEDVSNVDVNATPHMNISLYISEDFEVEKRVNLSDQKSFEQVNIEVSSIEDNSSGTISISTDPGLNVWNKYPAKVDEFVSEPLVQITEVSIDSDEVEVGESVSVDVTVLNGGKDNATEVIVDLNSSQLEVPDSTSTLSVVSQENNVASFNVIAPSDIDEDQLSAKVSASIVGIKDELGSSREDSIEPLNPLESEASVSVYERITELELSGNLVSLKKGESGEVKVEINNVNSTGIHNGVANGLSLNISVPSFVEISSTPLGVNSLGVNESYSQSFDLDTKAYEKELPLTGSIEWVLSYENAYGEAKEVSASSVVTIRNGSILESSADLGSTAEIGNQINGSITLENTDSDENIENAYVHLSSPDSSVEFSSEELTFGNLFAGDSKSEEFSVFSDVAGNYTVTLTIESSIGRQSKSFDVEFYKPQTPNENPNENEGSWIDNLDFDIGGVKEFVSDNPLLFVPLVVVVGVVGWFLWRKRQFTYK